MKAEKIQKIFTDMKADLRVRLVRMKSHGCSCQGGDDFCNSCVADEMLGTLNTADQRIQLVMDGDE